MEIRAEAAGLSLKAFAVELKAGSEGQPAVVDAGNFLFIAPNTPKE
jgi:hypothetical protein